jgi:protein phosphatase
VIRVAEHVERTDTGHQRSTNEDAHLARSPIFVIADGMGGAQAGEVASRLAVEHFADGLPGASGEDARERLVLAVRQANTEIHALSEADALRAGMGTTLTAAYVGPSEVSFAHVGDSRAYLLRDGELERITEDHSLVEELLRQGRLTEEEAEEHPQRSIITRALGPEPDVDVDTFAVEAADGDLYLICSDGLTSMISEATVAEILRGAPDLVSAAEQLIAAALDAGGRDNVTVVLFRVEEIAGAAGEPVDQPGADAEPATTQEQSAVASAPIAEAEAELAPPDQTAQAQSRSAEPAPGSSPAAEDVVEPSPSAQTATPPLEAATAPPLGVAAATPPPPVRRRAPRMPRARQARRGAGSRRRGTGAVVTLIVIGVIAVAAVLADQAVYFIGTGPYGQITVYNGIPYTLPGGLKLYSQFYVSGLTAAELSPLERTRLFNNQLRSQNSASQLVSQLELDRIAGQ